MIERLRHKAGDEWVALEVPKRIFSGMPESMQDRMIRLDALRATDKMHALLPFDDGWELSFDFAKYGAMTDRVKKGNAIKNAIELYDMFGSYPADTDEDPRLMVNFQLQPHENRYAMEAWARPMPAEPLADLQESVTSAMRRGAEALRHCPQPDIAYVGASFVLGEHIAFNTASIAASTLSTDGRIYRDSNGRIELTAGNFYSRTDQLVALAGLVAFVGGNKSA